MKYPQSPGVYWFLNAKKEVLYVGKAKNLRQRLKSYTLINQTAPKTKLLLTETMSIKFKITDSELEALILEAKLIKAHQPYYNILLKDDKSRLYLSFTKSIFPRLILTRQKGDYGPFPSSRQLNLALKIIRRIFPYCEQPEAKRACFYFHLNLCPGACCGQISPAEYKINIQNIKLLFSHKKTVLIKTLKHNLKKKIGRQEFEAAAKIRDQINALNSLNQAKLQPETTLPALTEDLNQEKLLNLGQILKTLIALPSGYPLNRIEAYDISHLGGSQATGAMVVSSNGRLSPRDYRYFKIKASPKADDPKMLQEVVQRRFNHPEWPQPNLILIDGAKTQLKAVQAVLPANIPLIGLTKHPDRIIGLQGETLKVGNQSGLLLLQQLRDEAHRFCRKLHLRLRTRSQFL